MMSILPPATPAIRTPIKTGPENRGQAIGIARALYSRPKLLVLDEATSALDAETERGIAMTLQEIAGDVTTVTIAHLRATVREADQVVYLDDGSVRGNGTFGEVRAAVRDFDQQARLLGL